MRLTETGTGWLRPGRKTRTKTVVDWRVYQRERLQRERDRIQQIHGALGLTVLDLLARHDPLGIVAEANPTEYEPVLPAVLSRLPAARQPEEIQWLAHQAAVEWLGADKAGLESVYLLFARDLWDVTKGAVV